MNKNLKIVRGKFTDAGNLTGRTRKGDCRVHIPAQVLETMEWTAEEDIEYPFFVVTELQTINQLALNAETNVMEPTGATNDRLTATSIFLTEDELADAYCEDALLNVHIAKKVKALAESENLTEQAIESLQQSVF